MEIFPSGSFKKGTTYLQLQMLNNGFKNLHPVLLERGVTVAWHRDLSHLSKDAIRHQMCYHKFTIRTPILVRQLLTSFRSETRTKSGKIIRI